MRILLVDEKTGAPNAILSLLSQSEVCCDAISVDDARLNSPSVSPYDLIILDLPFSRIESADVICRLKISMGRTPVLILSGAEDPDRILRALDMGADDYLMRPFGRNELIARIRSVVRRAGGQAGPVVRTGGISVNLDRRTVYVNGEPLHLTGREYAILELLSIRKGKTVTKEAILGHLYDGKREPDQKIIDVFVCTLRKKLSAMLNGECGIETVWGHGYVLRDPEEAPTLRSAV